MKRKISILLGIVTILIFGTMSLQANSLNTQTDDNECNKIINEYVQALGNDWEKVSSFFINEKRETYLNMYWDGAVKEHIGMFNIISAKLIEMQEVDYKDVEENLGFEEKETSIKTFVVGVDYEVYENTQFYSQGIAYRILAFQKEDNIWKIAKITFIENPEELQEKGYKFTNNYERCIRSMENRKKGILMNGDGEIFDRVFENVGGQVIRDDNEIEVLENNSNMAIGGMGDISTLRAHTSYPIPTSNTIITYAVLNSYNSVKSKYEINFKEFCLGCAAGEVSNDYFDGAARQANVIAIKTFVWHYYILPHDQDAGYNLNSTQINYNFQYLERTNINNISKDVLAVNNIWMESASGKIFAAYFKKGARNGDGKNGGELKQEGSYYLATQGYTRLGILHYYYDNSSASQAGPVQFFYTSGGSCYK